MRFLGMGLRTKMAVPHFVAQLPVGDFPLFDREHHVVGCPAEMLADGFPIICDYRDFHKQLPFHRFM
jgi:hypothetical protein